MYQISNTGWRRPKGCLESQVIFRKWATNYRALLRKMTYKDKVSYASSPPCIRYQSQSEYISSNSHCHLKMKPTRLFYRALLQKRPIISSILLTEATPYQSIHQNVSDFKYQIPKSIRTHKLQLPQSTTVIWKWNQLVSFIGLFCKRDLSFYRSC